MPAPKLIADAERDLHRALCAVRTLGGEVAHGLQTAETLMAEVRHFAYSTADTDKGLPSCETVSRLLSAILGYQVEIKGVSGNYTDTDAYRRLAR